MPSILNRAVISLKALRQLGAHQVALYARYRLGLYSGWLGYKTRAEIARALDQPAAAFNLHPLLQLPDKNELRAVLGSPGVDALLAEADEILDGHVRLFGADPVPLDLIRCRSDLPWIYFALGHASYGVEDVKLLWEPARFGWAFTLGRAYHLSRDERYAEAFWFHFEAFQAAHPPNLGPHWVSAQEVALRILAFTWAAQVYAPSSHTTPKRLTQLGRSVAAHAARIPASLAYARAQNNNHLLSEAVGLLTAGLALRDHPRASHWAGLGWYWLERGLLSQISPDGAYIQHSATYQRLMLHLALWTGRIIRPQGISFSGTVLQRLAAASRWLLALLDRTSGQVPNLGPNDGANILPLSTSPHNVYRPMLQAASRAFLDSPAMPDGIWDEMSLWLSPGGSLSQHTALLDVGPGIDPPVLHSPSGDSWAYLRTAHFTSRPGHADQLHLDLWWRGLNLAQDAGTCLYNAPPPWDNSLAHTAVHNTLTVNGHEQMTRAGRFLYLDWAQAHGLTRERADDGSWERLSASHDGYRRLGVTHRRVVTAYKEGAWLVEDHLEPTRLTTGGHFRLRLHWLLPDWPWQAEQLPDGSFHLNLESPFGRIQVEMGISHDDPKVTASSLQIVRAGEVLYGQGTASPTWGWVSPTYNLKLPALSLALHVEAPLPIHLDTRWLLSQTGIETTE